MPPRAAALTAAAALLLPAAAADAGADARVTVLLHDAEKNWATMSAPLEGQLRGWRVRKVNDGGRWGGAGHKVQAVIDALSDLDPQEIAVVADAYDVLLNPVNDTERATTRAIKAVLDAHPGAVIASTDSHCCAAALSRVRPGEMVADDGQRKAAACREGSPGCEWQEGGEAPWAKMMTDLALARKPKSGAANAFLNSGAVAGRAGDLRNVYAAMQASESEDEEALMTELLFRRPERFYLDYDQTIFGNNRWRLGEAEGCMYEKKAGSPHVVHRETGSAPMFLHTGGKFWSCYRKLAGLIGVDPTPLHTVKQTALNAGVFGHVMDLSFGSKAVPEIREAIDPAPKEKGDGVEIETQGAAAVADMRLPTRAQFLENVTIAVCLAAYRVPPADCPVKAMKVCFSGSCDAGPRRAGAQSTELAIRFVSDDEHALTRVGDHVQSSGAGRGAAAGDLCVGEWGCGLRIRQRHAVAQTVGDPFTTYKGRTVQFYLPLRREVELIACGSYAVHGRTMPGNVPGDSQQWFDKVRVTRDGAEVATVETRGPAELPAPRADDEAAVKVAREELVAAALQRAAEPLRALAVTVGGTELRTTTAQPAAHAGGSTWTSVARDAEGSEVVDIVSAAEAFALSVRSSLASKPGAEAHGGFPHLDLSFPKIHEDACAGVLPEIWGIKPMSAETVTYLSAPGKK